MVLCNTKLYLLTFDNVSQSSIPFFIAFLEYLTLR